MAIVGWLLITGILFILGAAVGSFLNVLVYRSVRDEDWVRGRSRCEICGKKLHWYENIPLLSFLLQRGRCRKCKKAISIAHPVVELLTGALFVWWYWGGALFFQLTATPFQTLQPLFWLLVGLCLIGIVIADTLYMIIPDLLVGLLLVMTILYRLILTFSGIMRLQDLLYAVFGLVLSVAFFGGLWLLTKGKGMGLGDVKLVAPLSLLLGWPYILVGLFLAFVTGAIAGLGIIGFQRLSLQKGIKKKIPFGPFLVLGTVLTLVWGNPLLEWYLALL